MFLTYLDLILSKRNLNLSPVKQRPPFDYNNYDRKYKIDRNSVVVYTVENGLPLNPFGRTGYYYL